MLMRTKSFVARVGRVLLGTALFIAMAGPVAAGNVYSWVTEDGTYAFTDDPKRIPAMHRDEAVSRPMGDLKRYARYTVDRTGKTYTDRLRERQADLRERAMAQQSVVATSPAPTAAGASSSLVYGVPFIGGGSPGGHRGAQMQLGLGSLTGAGANANAMASNEPITVESVRMQPSKGQATRHWTIIKQGDRVISVIKGENRDRKPEGVSESDFDF